MTALQWIIKEAKILRKKSPKMEWKKAVAQASAIYSSKHKGKSPVGKKKSAKKVVRKKAAKKKIGKVDPNKAFKKQMQVNKIINTKYKNWEYPVPPVYTGNWTATIWSDWIKKNGKKIGAVKHKVVRKKVAKKKKISETGILNRIHKVKKDVERLDEAQHKHMVGMNNDIYHKMALVNTEIIAKERGIRKWIQLKKGLVEKYGLAHYKKIQKNQRHLINELKKHKSELKKLI